jgi:hypothetical protein
MFFIQLPASNVTGALADVHAVTAVLHSHAALAGAALTTLTFITHSPALFWLLHTPPWQLVRLSFSSSNQCGTMLLPLPTFTCTLHLSTPSHFKTQNLTSIPYQNPTNIPYHVRQIKRACASQATPHPSTRPSILLFPHTLLYLLISSSHRGIDALILSPHKFNGGPGSPGNKPRFNSPFLQQFNTFISLQPCNTICRRPRHPQVPHHALPPSHPARRRYRLLCFVAARALHASGRRARGSRHPEHSWLCACRTCICSQGSVVTFSSLAIFFTSTSSAGARGTTMHICPRGSGDCGC